MINKSRAVESNAGKILIVDKEATSMCALSQVVIANGFQVKEASSAEEALTCLGLEKIDGVFFHFPLSQSNDLYLMGRARQISPEMLIVVQDDQPTTERAIVALKAGVADYLTGPCNAQEVAQSVVDAFRRHHERIGRLTHVVSQALEVYFRNSWSQPGVSEQTATENGSTLTAGNLRLIRGSRTLISLDEERPSVKLTKGESDVLGALMVYSGEAITCREIVREAWGYDMIDAEAKSVVRPYISRLRHKLNNTSIDASTITTVRGIGYMFAA